MHKGSRGSWSSALGGALVALAFALTTAAHALTQDISGQFAITRSGPVLNRTTNTFDTSVTLKNSSDAPVLAPVDVVVGGLPAGVTLANKTGDEPDGRPFIRPMAAGSMLQSGATLTFVLKFANPARVSFNSTLQVLHSVENAPGAPILIGAVATGATTALLTGRIDDAANRDVAVQAMVSRTCVSGVLVDGAPAGSPVAARTDRDGYFSIAVPGVRVGDFVTMQLTSPAPTGPSSCLVSSRDNDSWPKAFLLDGSTSTVSDFIDVAGKARWYKFAVSPGQRIDITLSGLPADYDLAAFKDIGEAFASQFNPATAGPSDLLKLTAEYAPSTFSPSTFSPSTFSPSTFSPDAYSPSTFSPSTFSPSVFSPSTFSPSTFSPSTFSPSTFSPSTFSPSTFSPSTFSPSTFSPSIYTLTEIQQAFSTAQTRSIVAVSATAGLSDESAVVNTWNRTGHFYVRVTGRNGAFDTTRQFTLTVTKGITTCSGVDDTALTARSRVAASGLKTVLLTDSSKVDLDAPLNVPGGGTLRAKLAAFAARPEIAGVLVDVATHARVRTLKQQAANHPACPYAKNLVAEEIKGIVDSYRSNPLQYVVIVGNDDAIPFFRSPDQSVIGQESGYVPPVSSNSPSEASLRRDFVLSQDKYGSKTSISLPWNEFPVPGLAVGRVVETASEIAGLIDAYVAADAIVTPRTSLVTGYDFLEDAAIAVKSELDAGTGLAGDALITPSGTSPQSPASWKAQQLAAKLFGARHDVIFLAGHFSANSALAADFSTSLLTTDLVASPADFTNSIVFSAGCHAGYNLVDGDSIPGVTLPLDWAQAFARKRATLIAGTGYQYGDTDFLEYSERLYSNFARQLRAGAAGTPVSVGEALVQAKLAYLAATPDIRGLHEKALLEATLFGLPMLAVNMPAGRGAIPGTGGAIGPTPVGSGPAATLGLRTFDLSVAPALTTRTQSLVNLQGGPGITARWVSGPDGVLAKPGEPALPLAVINVTPTDPALVLRGIGYRGGNYSDTGPMIPFTGAATTESRGVHVPFLSPVFYPTTMWTPNYFGALAGTGGTQLLVSPVQHRAASIVDGTSTERLHSSMSLRLFYSGNVSQAALSDAPSIVAVDAERDAAGAITFAANVVGDPAAAIYQVWVTFTGDGTNAWLSLDLAQCVAPLPAACANEDSRLWKGRLAAPPANIRYFVQAANGVGLVSRNDNLGANFGLMSLLPTATRLDLVSPPSSAIVGDSPSVTARLSYAGGVALAGKVVVIGVGGTSRFGVTGGDGNVTIRVPMVATPGNYLITAAFAGDEVYQASSTSSPLTISRAPVTPTVLPPAAGTAGINIAGSLGGTSTALQQVPVAFTVQGPTGTTTVFSITDYLGNAIFPPPSGLPPGNYTVMQASFGGDGSFVPTTITFATPLQVSVPKLNQSITFDRTANGLDSRNFGDPDFAVVASASSGLAVSFSASGACTISGNSIHLTSTGSCTIDADQAGDAAYNPAPRVTHTFFIGTPAAAPTVLSLARAAPSPTMSDTVDYTLTFSEPVTGVAASNFTVFASGITGASVFGIGGSGATWTITVNTGLGTGTLHLDLVNGNGIANAGGTALAGAPVTGETYQIDKGGTVVGNGEGRPLLTFGSAGYALFSDVPRVAAPSAMAVLPDGRLLAAGGIACAANVPPTPDDIVYCTLQLARYLPNGTPDSSFGTNGRLVTAITRINPELSGLFVNGDGSFAVAGSRDNGSAEVPFAAWFTANGVPIDTFGASGIAALDSLPLGLGITGSTVDASGRVLIVGTTPDAGPDGKDIFVARLTSTGALDPLFGNGGVARFAISTVDGRSDHGTAVAVQPDGKIVVGGRTQVTAGLGSDFVVLRLSANGTFDSSFVNGGIATTRFAGTTGDNLGRKLVLQPDGKIVLVGGIATGATTFACGIARFDANGVLDPSFGAGGRVVEPLTAGCFHVSLRSDGKLVVVGNDQIGAVSYGSLVRLLPTGVPDAAFGNAGILDISGFGTPGRVAFTGSGNLVTSLVIEDPADGAPKSYVVELTGGLAPNQPPIANAGADQTVVAGATVQLTSAGSSDPEGNPLTYAWTMTAKPVGSAAAFNNSTFANPTFIADRKGTYTAELVVNDGGSPPLDSAPDSIQITATNRAPTASGDSYTVGTGATLSIDAATGVLANDTDPDGDPLTVALGSTVTHGSLTLNADGSFTYTASTGYSGPDSFTYRANDGTLDSNVATVSLTVTSGIPVNHPPVANAGGSIGALVGSTLQLGSIGSCTDADNDPTTRAWSVVARPTGSTAQLFVDATPGSPSFTPDLAGFYQLQLICNDGHVDSSPSILGLTASPPPQSAIFVGSLTLAPGQSQAFTVSLTMPAPAGGLTVSLSSSDTNVVTVPASVFVAGGAIGPTVSPTATAGVPGTATITATASGYDSGTGAVVVGAPSILTVTNTNDSGAGSLRDAIAQANLDPEPNVITFAPGVIGTIALTTGQIRIANPLTIVGPGAANLTIDGGLNGRIFTILEANAPDCPALSGPTDFQVSISGLTLSRGSRNVADSGGGAIQSAKTLVLSDVIIRDSQAKGGGGLLFNAQYPGQSLIITSSQFLNNVAKPVVTGDTNSHNGGALLVHDYCGGTRVPIVVSINSSVFTGNRVQPAALEGRGGAIAVYDNASLQIVDTRIVDNHVEPPAVPDPSFSYPGGGIQTTTTAVTIFRSEIAANSADYGAGISVSANIAGLQDVGSAFLFQLLNSTVSGNTATKSAGAILLHGNVSATIGNSTVAANSAPATRTAGVQISSGPTNPPSAAGARPPELSIVSSIVANGALNAADIGGLPSPSIASPYSIEVDNSLIVVPPSADFVLAGTGNHVGEDPKLLPLAQNGGPTRTHELQAGSPAIDTGSNVFGFVTDQRGEGFARVLGTAADMGAYERVPSTGPTAPVITTTTPGSIRRNQRTVVQVTGTGLAGSTVSSTDTALQVSGVSSSALQVNFSVDVPSGAALGVRTFTVANSGGQATVTLQVAPALTLSVLPATIALPPDNVNHTYTLQVNEASPFAQSFVLAALDPGVLRVATTFVTIPANALQGSFALAGVTNGTTQLRITPAGGDEAVLFQVLVGPEAASANAVYAPVVGLAKGDPSQAPGGTQTRVIARSVGLARGDPSQAPGGTTTQVIARAVGLAKGDPSQAPSGTTTQVIAPPVGLAKGDPSQVPAGTATQVIARSIGLAKGDPSQAPSGTTTQVIAKPVGLLKGDFDALPPGQIVGPLIARPVGLNRL